MILVWPTDIRSQEPSEFSKWLEEKRRADQWLTGDEQTRASEILRRRHHEGLFQPDEPFDQNHVPAAIDSLFRLRAPDLDARILKTEIKTGLPEDLIRFSLTEIESAATVPTFDPKSFLRTSAIAARWRASVEAEKAAMRAETARRERTAQLIDLAILAVVAAGLFMPLIVGLRKLQNESSNVRLAIVRWHFGQLAMVWGAAIALIWLVRSAAADQWDDLMPKVGWMIVFAVVVLMARISWLWFGERAKRA